MYTGREYGSDDLVNCQLLIDELMLLGGGRCQ